MPTISDQWVPGGAQVETSCRARLPSNNGLPLLVHHGDQRRFRRRSVSRKAAPQQNGNVHGFEVPIAYVGGEDLNSRFAPPRSASLPGRRRTGSQLPAIGTLETRAADLTPGAVARGPGGSRKSAASGPPCVGGQLRVEAGEEQMIGAVTRTTHQLIAKALHQVAEIARSTSERATWPATMVLRPQRRRLPPLSASAAFRAGTRSGRVARSAGARPNSKRAQDGNGHCKQQHPAGPR